MAVNKVVYNAKSLLDLTSDTVTPETLASGVTAHDKSGNQIVGTLPIDELVNGEDYLAYVLNKEITELVNSKVKKIESYFQKDNKNLLRVDLPALTEMGEQNFSGCSKVTSIKLPALVKMSSGEFGSTKCTQMYFPSLETMKGWGYNFNQCGSLKRVYFPKLTEEIGNREFENCNQMDTVILGANVVVPLKGTIAFTRTPIALYNNKVGYVYVPRALVDSYKSATNWSTYASQIRAIEDYPEVLEGWT